MRTNHFHIILVFVAIVGSARGAVDSTVTLPATVAIEADSIPSYSLSEITVTALRPPDTPARSASPVTVLERRQLQLINATSLADAIASLPGVFIKNYGGVSGLKTISQRGLGAEHTLVLINGMRVSNPQNGLVDLGLIEEDQLERLELVRGGQSAGYGADPVAGVVNAVLRPSAVREGGRAVTSMGSFGYRKYRIAAVGQLDGATTLGGSYREEKAAEDFPFVLRNGTQRFDLLRRNADFLSRTGLLQADVLLGKDVHASVFGRTYGSERGVGGPVVGPASISTARQKDEDNILQLILRYRDSWPMRYRLGMQFHQTFQRYEDRNFIVGSSWLNNHSRIVELRIEPGAEWLLQEGTRLVVGADVARTHASGNALRSNVLRWSYAAYATLQQRIPVEGSTVKDILVVPALRYDRIRTGEESLTHVSPQLGVVCTFQKIAGAAEAMLRASVSRNFRAPTFNELYYAGGGGIGNPGLQPERSIGFDVGGEMNVAFAGMHHLQCTYFDIAMRNRIVWTSAGGMNVTPKNLRRVRSRGIELSYSWSVLNEALTFGANYVLLSARKTEADYPGDPTVNTFLIYVPQEVANYSVGLRLPVGDSWFRETGVAVHVSRVGHRYVTEDNQRFLPSYTLVDLNSHVKLQVAGLFVFARLEVNNLFNEEYQSVPAYPMPLRSFRGSFGIEF